MVKIFPDQKEYLKKYLSGNKQKNLKKKSLNTSKGVKLIDDDETIKSANLDDDEIFLDGEEAPQIVLGDGIDSSSLQDGLKRWKSISAIQMKVQEKSKFLNNFSTVSSPSTSKIGDEERNVNLNSRQLNENNSVSKPKKYINDKQDHSLKHDSACSDNLSSRILYEDASPTTRQRKSISNHYSPERNNFKKNDRNKDLSSPKRRNRSPSNDLSPQRIKTTERNKIKYSSLKCVEKTLTTGLSPQTRRTSTNDISPQRKRSSRWDAVNKTRESQDFSPVMPKKSSSSSDKSPQRKNDFEKKNSKQELPKKRSSCDNKSSLYRKNRSDQGKIDSEERTRKDLKGSTKKRNHSIDLLVRSSSSDLSPQRKKNEKGHNDRESFPIKRRTTYNSPSRNYKSNSRSTSRTKQGYTKNQKENLSTKQNNNPHLSPPRFEKTYRKGISNEDRVIKMADGKLSGLRNAKDLQEDIKYIREKEYELLKETSIQAGQYAEPVIRSHARYNLESLENELKNKKKEEENEKKQEVYNRWGKGLKQIEDHKTKLVEQKYESTKPLARYADDKDLDKMLKQVEREGDPMLEYLRSKKEKDRIHKKHAEIPIYKGSYPENRYSIRPGYRWDGVDRSNGYEKKYFEKQNAKRALEEEAYRYSTEDM